MEKEYDGPAYPVNELGQRSGNIHQNYLGMTRRQHWVEAMVANMVSAWPDRTDWTEMIKRANDGFDALLESESDETK